MTPPKIRRWSGVAVLLLAALLFHHSFRIDWVSGSSMLPTFHDGDWLLVAKRHSHSPEPERGDLVIAQTPSGFLVKRVVGLPGERVEVIDGAVHIDGRPQPTGAPCERGCLQLARGRLLPHRYALLGDHRDVTPDLAEHAVVGRGDLVGHVMFRLFPRPGRVRKASGPNEPFSSAASHGSSNRP